MATKTYSPNEQLPASVAGPIQQSISQIQAGISSLSGGSSGGSVASPNNYVSTNPADSPVNSRPGVRYQNPGVVPTQPTVGPTQPIPEGQLDPSAEAPAGLAQQATNLQGQVNQLATQKGLTLKQTATGGYSAVPDESALRKQAHQSLTQSGVPASQSAGVGSAVTQSALGNYAPQTESPSILGPIQETDSMFDSLFVEYDKFFSPQEQRTSLLDEYSKLSKNLGVDSMNQELIDTKRIIDSTEDDIRLEIQSAGGVATESQVLAMANARNKQLIKNYNYLLDTKNAATTQLTTLMNLSVQDREFANAEFDRKMNFAFKVQEFRDKAVINATTQFKYLIDNGFGGAILANPNDARVAEKVLGLPQGGLASVVAQQAQITSLATRKTEADIANIYSQIDERNKPEPQEDLGAYVLAYQNGQIPLTQVPQKVRGQVLATVQANGQNKLLDLMNQYKNKLTGLNFFTANTPSNKTALGSLKGQITAEYKQQKQLGTLDAGVQTLIDQIIPDPSKLNVSSLSNKAQVEAIDNFIKNQGGGAIPAPDNSGDVIILED